MTNGEIIFNTRIKLHEDGLIAGTGVHATVTKKDGSKKVIELPEELHTFAVWKQLGFSVIKGQKAITKIDIWKYAAARSKDSSDEAEQEETPEGKGQIFRKTAAFFAAHQVELTKA